MQNVVGVLSQFVTKNHTVTLLLLPLCWWDGEENQKEKRQKLVGWDENNLTQWQREKKTINSTDKKHIQHTVFSPPMLSLLLSSQSLSFSQLPT